MSDDMWPEQSPKGPVRKYRKKPVVIEAIQWTGNNWNDVCQFIPVPETAIGEEFPADDHFNIYIDTLEGRMTCSTGDYIIKGVEGEFYPCKPDIFHKTYQEVS